MGECKSSYVEIHLVIVSIGVFSRQVEIHFVSSLTWEGLGQHELSWTFNPCWHGSVWSTYLEIHIVTLSVFEVFGQHMYRCISCSRRHWMMLVNTFRDASRALAGIDCDCSTHVKIHFVLAGMCWV
jgi:hypothetical protein